MAQSKKNDTALLINYTPPQAINIEKLVLGALMIDSRAFDLIGDRIQPNFFYDKKHEKIYKAIQRLAYNGKPIDFATVDEQLKKEDDAKIDISYLFELISNVASSVNIEYHADILTDKYKARELISLGSKLVAQANDDNNDIEEVTKDAENKLFELFG